LVILWSPFFLFLFKLPHEPIVESVLHVDSQIRQRVNGAGKGTRASNGHFRKVADLDKRPSVVHRVIDVKGNLSALVDVGTQSLLNVVRNGKAIERDASA